MLEIFISQVIPWLITCCFSLLIVCFILYIPKLLKTFWQLNWLVRIILILTIAIGVLIRFKFVPNTYRIYYDEDRYLSYAVSFAKFGQAKSIKFADPKKLIGDPDQALRLTVPILNAWVIKFFGDSVTLIFIAAKISSSIQIILLFIFAYLYTRSSIIALFTSIGTAILPNIVYWSTSSSLDPYFVTFALIASIATLLYSQKSNFLNSLFLTVSLFTLLCVRLEAFVFLPIFGGFYYFERKKNKKAIFSHSEIHFYILLLAVIGLRALASLSVLGQKWCCAEALPIESFYPNYFIRNLLPNIGDLFLRAEFPGILTIMALISLIQLKNKKIIMLGIWFFGFFILYSFYYAGMFYTGEFSGSYGRYFLILNPPLLMLAGITFEQFIRFLNKYSKSVRVIFFAGILFLNSLIFRQTIIKYPNMIATSPYYSLVEAGPAYVHDFVDHFMIPNTPKSSYLLSSLTAVTYLSGRSAGTYGFLIDDKEAQNLILSQLESKVRVYSTFGLQCPPDQTECLNFLKKVDFTPVVTKRAHPDGIEFVELKLRKK